jgi:ankyrin repeat protein
VSDESDGPQAEGLPPLLELAYWGDLAGIQECVSRGESLEVTDELGSTPLILAAVQDHANCVAALLEGGADMTARTNYGDTALTLAASNGHLDVVRTLLLGGADPLATGSLGRTGIDFAKEQGHEDIVELIGNWSSE